MSLVDQSVATVIGSRYPSDMEQCTSSSVALSRAGVKARIQASVAERGGTLPSTRVRKQN